MTPSPQHVLVPVQAWRVGMCMFTTKVPANNSAPPLLPVKNINPVRQIRMAVSLTISCICVRLFLPCPHRSHCADGGSKNTVPHTKNENVLKHKLQHQSSCRECAAHEAPSRQHNPRTPHDSAQHVTHTPTPLENTREHTARANEPHSGSQRAKHDDTVHHVKGDF